MLAERDIAKLCTRRWDKLGLLYRRVAWIGRNGAPDFVVMGEYRATDWPTRWVETKRPGKKPTSAQALEHQRMHDAGQTVLVIATAEDLDRYFPL